VLRQEPVLLDPHRPRGGPALRVIAAQEVKDAVDQQERDLSLRRVTRGVRLPGGGPGGDDDVAQQPGAHAAVVAFGEGKRQHVGRAVLPAVAAVEVADLRVPDQADRELAVSES
jgi:hypothetical protein